MSFTELKDRFIRLSQRDIPAEEADRIIRRLGAQAAQLYCRYAKRGVDGFEIEWCRAKMTPGDVLGNEKLWYHTWWTITGMLEGRYCGHVPFAFGDGDVQPARPQDAGADVKIFITTFPPERWRQRCEDDAVACGLLARLGEKHEAAERKRSDDNERPEAIAVPRGTDTAAVKRVAKEAVREVLAQPTRDALVSAWRIHGSCRAAASALAAQGHPTSKSSVARAVEAARRDGEDVQPAVPRSAVPRAQLSHPRDTSN